MGFSKIISKIKSIIDSNPTACLVTMIMEQNKIETHFDYFVMSSLLFSLLPKIRNLDSKQFTIHKFLPISSCFLHIQTIVCRIQLIEEGDELEQYLQLRDRTRRSSVQKSEHIAVVEGRLDASSKRKLGQRFIILIMGYWALSGSLKLKPHPQLLK